MTSVKVCGLTREEDVVLACELGASWLGFNFANESPRRVSLSQARALSAAAADGVSRVGVFVNETAVQIARAVEAASLDVVQLHRPLAPLDFELPRPLFTVVSVSGSSVPEPDRETLARCRAVLFDSKSGGSGRTFDWSLLERTRWPVPILVAGGLTPENVAEAIARVRPLGVDVSSGVESSPGIKDAARMRRFFEIVGEADARLA